MSKGRLNIFMILHVYKDFTDKLYMQEVGNKFFSKNEHCIHVLGTLEWVFLILIVYAYNLGCTSYLLEHIKSLLCIFPYHTMISF